jgi:hypothetical protein
MMLDYQATLYHQVYDIAFGQPATLITTGGNEIAITVVNKTAASPFLGVGVEYQAFKPLARMRMADVLANGLTPVDDIIGGQLVMDGNIWSIKTTENIPSPVGINDGELALILKNDANL